MKFDPSVTARLQAFVNANEADRDYAAGALLLAKISGNRIEYQNNINNLERKKGHILNRLRKYLDFRLAAMTHEQVAEMTAEADKIVTSIPAKERKYNEGKRTDHDDLPDDIQAAYVETLDILRKQQELHYELKKISIREVTCPDSERYPFAKEIIELDKKRLALWKKYDGYGQ